MALTDLLIDITTADYVTAILSIAAIIISIISLTNDSKNLKKELRLSKLEELIAITIDLKYCYEPIYKLQLISKDLREQSKNIEAKRYNGGLYQERLEQVEKAYPYVDINNKLTRFQILTNSYIPESSLKNNLYCVYDLYWKLVDDAYKRNSMGTRTAFPEGYPSYRIFTVYCEFLEKGLIEEMGLGYRGSDWGKLKEYREKVFVKVLRDLKVEEDNS